MRRSLRCLRHSAGHTLLEMLLSVTLLSVIAASIGSAMMFAASATPDADETTATLKDDSRVISRIAEDIALARYVIERSDHAITIVVSDRTGDGNPDRLRYAWDGSTGDALTYQLNDGDAVALLDAVAEFSMTYTDVAVSGSLPIAHYLGAESVIDGLTNTDSTSEREIEWGSWYGQVVRPGLESGAYGFYPTKLSLYASGKSPYTGETLVTLKDRSGASPGTTTYASQTIYESTLDWQNLWRDIDFSGASFVTSGENLGLYLSHVTGNNVVLNILETSNGNGKIQSSDRGVSWELDGGKTLLYQLHGRQHLVDQRQHGVDLAHLTSVEVTLQSVGEKRSPLSRSVRMLLSPPKLSGFAETGFDSDPLPMDLNADGVADWSHNLGSVPTGSINGGCWTANGKLTYADKSLYTADVIRVTARMRSNDSLGPVIYGPYTINDSNELLPIATQLRGDGFSGQELVIYNDTTMATEFAVISGLPDGLVDVELTLVPGEDLLSIDINHEPIVSLRPERIADPGTISPGVSFGSSGGVAEFGSIYIRVGGEDTTGGAEGSGALPGGYELLLK